MTDKPHFYLMDLDNYNEDFLKEIILWYDEELKRVQDSIKLTKTNQESKKFLKDGEDFNLGASKINYVDDFDNYNPTIQSLEKETKICYGKK
jgi:hypothetical protein